MSLCTYVCANYNRKGYFNRLNHISRKSISSTSQHHSNVQEVTQTDADDDDFRGSSTLSVSGEKEEIDEELGTLSCTRVQTTPTSTNVDLSIPGAFAQHSHCSNKRCNDTECSNYRDIGESTYSCIFVA